MATTLITGGTGLIGSAVAARLLERGDGVVALDVMPAPDRVAMLRDRFPSGLLEVVRGDVSSPVVLLDLVQRYRVDAIVHLASLLGPDSDSDPGTATRVNCAGTASVLDVGRLAGLRRVVLASSIAVYGDDSCYTADAFPLAEDAAQRGAPGMRMYAAAKIYSEHLALHYQARFGLSVLVLRPSIVHGPGRRSGATSVVTRLVEDAMFEAVTVGLGNARMSLVYVEEVAGQFVALLDARSGGSTGPQVFNSGGFTCTVRDLADVVRRIIPAAQITVEASAEQDVGGLASSVSSERIDTVLGYQRQFPTIEDGVRHQMDLVRSQRELPALPT